MASSFNPSLHLPKALPLVVKNDDLPPAPSSPLRPMPGPPPMPPPKSATEAQIQAQSMLPTVGEQLSDHSPRTTEVLSPSDVATSAPDSPSSQPAASGPPSPGAQPTNMPRSKKANPFVDLLETEKIYVDTLSGIIRVCRVDLNRVSF